MTTADPRPKTFKPDVYREELEGSFLTPAQVTAISEGVEKVSNDNFDYYAAMLKIWQGHQEQLDEITGELKTITGVLKAQFPDAYAEATRDPKEEPTKGIH